VNEVAGVSESIIMGIPMPTGTGPFKVKQQADVQPDMLRPRQRPPPLVDF
jgi:DNA-directed RNA polymerase III subunit RPC1